VKNRARHGQRLLLRLRPGVRELGLFLLVLSACAIGAWAVWLGAQTAAGIAFALFIGLPTLYVVGWREVTAGLDGFAGGPRFTWYVHASQITAVRLASGWTTTLCIEVRLASGATLSLVPARGVADSEIRQIAQYARHWYLADKRPVRADRVVDRILAERDPRELAARLARSDGPYRDSSVTIEELTEVMNDPWSPPAARGMAAVALSLLPGAEDRTVFAELASSVAHPGLQSLLYAIADSAHPLGLSLRVASMRRNRALTV
jgi:hypothetical protein